MSKNAGQLVNISRSDHIASKSAWWALDSSDF